MMKYLVTCAVLFLGLGLSHQAWAQAPASIRLLGPIGTIRLGDSAALQVQVDSTGQHINAAEIHVRYNPQAVAVTRISREQSLFTLWPELPQWDEGNGDITMTGGRPGGIVSVNGAVATIYVKALRTGSAQLEVSSDSSLFLNDGQGTRVPVSTSKIELHVSDLLIPGIVLTSTTHPTSETWSRGQEIAVHWEIKPDTFYSYQLSQDSQAVPDDVPEVTVGDVRFSDLADGIYHFTIVSKAEIGGWSSLSQRRFLLDSTPPEHFDIVHPNQNDVAGQNIITWSAIDETSGLEKSVLSIDGRVAGEVASPLALNPKWVGKTLTITVFDQAGNTTESHWESAESQRSPRSNPLSRAVVAAVVVLAALTLFFVVRIWLTKRSS